MKNINITTLGGFRILVDGDDLVKELGTSRKKVLLLQYLILHRNTPVTNMTIFDTIWPGDDNKNPLGALKTLISRLRVDMSKFGLGDAITTGVGTYSWNPSVPCSLDLDELEQLHDELAHVKTLDGDSTAKFERAIALYGGELFPESSSELWVMSKSVFYHDMFIRLMYRYVELLSAEKKDAEIARVCRAVLEQDPMDTDLNLALMRSLVAQDRHDDAQKRFEYIKNLYMTQYKSQPPKALLDYYNDNIDKWQVADEELDRLRGELTLHENDDAVFTCDYPTFKKLFQMQVRTLRNLRYSIFLALVYPARSDGAPLSQNDMRSLMDILAVTLQSSLRKECTICPYSDDRYLLLLPMVDNNTVRIVMDRIQQNFSRNCRNETYIFDYKLLPVDDSM